MIPASTQQLWSASHHESSAAESGDLGEEADAAEETTVDAPEEAELPSLGAKSTASECRYNTRPTNDPHPARTAHLARCSHAEVWEELVAEVHRKKAELDAQRDEYQCCVNELAELEEDINSWEIENSMRVNFLFPIQTVTFPCLRTRPKCRKVLLSQKNKLDNA